MNDKQKKRRQNAIDTLRHSDFQHNICIFGSMNDHVRHGGVRYICVKEKAFQLCCFEHGHSGQWCCIDILTPKKGEPVGKKGKKGKKGRNGSKVNRICPMNKEAYTPCLSPVYYCSVDKIHYCFQHTHPYQNDCCKYSEEASNRVNLMSQKEWENETWRSSMANIPTGPSLGGETADSEDDSFDTDKCEKCSAVAVWYCTKRLDYRCGIHAHKKNCCEYLELYDSSDTDSDENAPRKAKASVTFANG